MTELSYARVIERAAQWHTELGRIKADNPPQDFTWYGYDILSNLWHIEGLLGLIKAVQALSKQNELLRQEIETIQKRIH